MTFAIHFNPFSTLKNACRHLKTSINFFYNGSNPLKVATFVNYYIFYQSMQRKNYKAG